jgi:hypothetical protein
MKLAIILATWLIAGVGAGSIQAQDTTQYQQSQQLLTPTTAAWVGSIAGQNGGLTGGTGPVFNSATNTTPASSNYKIAINLAEVNETLGSSDSRAVGYCNDGGYKYKDIGATTGVEIRDGNGNLLATGVLGSATVIDVPGQALGTCSYAPVLEVKKSDFYQIKIGTRYDKSFSFADLEKVNWKITLFIGS